MMSLPRFFRRALLVLGLLFSAGFSAAAVRLQWADNSNNESGFKIERALGTGSFVHIATTGPNVVTYHDKTVGSGKRYRYRVRAFNAAGHSAYSNLVDTIVAAVTDVVTGPSTPANTAPTISAVANQSIGVGLSTSALSFTIGDAQTSVNSLNVSAASSNLQVVPASAVSLGGSGAKRTVTIKPATNVVGQSTITLTVSDGSLRTTSAFVVTVTNTAPTLSALSAHSIASGAPATSIPFTIGDAQTSASALTVTRSSSNSSVLPTAAVVLSGSGASRTVSIAAPAGVVGTSTVAITVSDGLLSTTRNFTVTVTRPNSAPTITTVPATKVVANRSSAALPFTVADRETAAASLTVTAATSNSTLLPTSGVQLSGTGGARTVTLKPAANKTGSATVTLTVSDGALSTKTSFTVTVPNTAPTVLGLMDQVVQRSTTSAPIPLRIGDAETAATGLVVRATSNNGTLFPSSALILGGSGANRTLTLKPSTGATGRAVITVTVDDGATRTDTSFVTLVSDGSDGLYFSTHPVSRLVKNGTAVTFTANAFGFTAPAYQWRRNGVVIPGATQRTLTLPSVAASAGGVYDVMITAAIFARISQPAILQVNPSGATGVHKGSFGNVGTWSLLNRSDKTALYLAELVNPKQTVALEVEVAADGKLTVVHTAVDGPSNPSL